MMREPRWGELNSVKNHEAYCIWLTRFDEPKNEQPLLMQCQTHEEFEYADYIFRRLVDSLLKGNPRLSIIIHERYKNGKTLRELAEMLDLTRERVRQIEGKFFNQVRAYVGDSRK